MKSYCKYILYFSLPLLTGCKKLVDIPKAVGFITPDQVFSNDDEALSAAAGMYDNLNSSGLPNFANAGTTIFCGMSADELNSFALTTPDYNQINFNTLTSENGVISRNFWNNAYSVIYSANSIIEGLQGYSGVHDSLKNELIGEAAFVRAFCYFYLTNLFGDVPMVMTINYHKTSLLSRSPVDAIYQQIITDLKDAQKRLPADYSSAGGLRIIPNKWAATALLARVYLYRSDWQNAEVQASGIIDNSGLFGLTDSLNDVFLINSTEAIWQLQQNNKGTQYNATMDGYTFIPYPSISTSQPSFYLTSTLLHSFETGDRRRKNWVDSTIFQSATYYYPYKFKVDRSQATPNGDYKEFNMVLRVAEQYLIRAEARAEEGIDLNGSGDDLNRVRRRAGLGNTGATTKEELLDSILHERQIEYFAEWGHRWMDIKRSGLGAQILSTNKGFNVDKNALLYPIPFNDLTVDPNLTQNKGY